eukprot:2653596-Prymnesium_polylepis.2
MWAAGAAWRVLHVVRQRAWRGVAVCSVASTCRHVTTRDDKSSLASAAWRVTPTCSSVAATACSCDALRTSSRSTVTPLTSASE